jgi:CRP/FNR family cyclic AMP-dependent transcriptional regulator
MIDTIPDDHNFILICPGGKMDTVNFLHKVPLFKSLNKKQLEQLASWMIKREFKAGQAIVEQGKGGEGFFVVVTGKAEATRVLSDGTKVVVNQFGPTDFFGELALLDEGIRTATVVATEKVECLVLVRWDFLAKLETNADMAVKILQELASRFRQALDAL